MAHNKQGIIVAHYGVAVDVYFPMDKTTNMVRVKRNSGHVVGDEVTVKGELLTRLARTTELSRMNARGAIHTVGANLDTLCIVISCEPFPPPGFIDRAIVSSRAAKLQPLLIVNKADLANSDSYHSDIRKRYEKSLLIFFVSAENGFGLSTLTEYFKNNHRGIFVGPSGVGKSSILNTILPQIDLQTQEISSTKKRGKNTTTVSTLHRLSGGGELIDSPGFNDFGLVDITPHQLSQFFPGFEEPVDSLCQFRDCKHRSEPGCQVIKYIQQHKIPTERYKTYLQILDEVEAIQNEPKYRERRNRRKKN